MLNLTSFWKMTPTAARSCGTPLAGRSSKGQGWIAALYGREKASDEWDGFSFVGMCPIYLDAPVTLVSFYEAAAYAIWAGKRQPTEPKWEITARRCKCDANLKSSHT